MVPPIWREYSRFERRRKDADRVWPTDKKLGRAEWRRYGLLHAPTRSGRANAVILWELGYVSEYRRNELFLQCNMAEANLSAPEHRSMCGWKKTADLAYATKRDGSSHSCPRICGRRATVQRKGNSPCVRNHGWRGVEAQDPG